MLLNLKGNMMVSGINNVQQSIFQPQMYQRQLPTMEMPSSLTSFDAEVEAIISSQANMLNVLDQFNSGEGNTVELAVACVMAKITASAEANVIQAKKDMIDVLLEAVD